MNTARKQSESDAKALWSITWRSVVLLPLFFPVALLWFILVVAIGVLPIVAVAYLWFGEWRQAGIYFAIWALLLTAYRRFRLGRWFEWPPSVL